jgi:error-prone DNA polymerase
VTESFVHLHVASGYSMRYGTAKPEQLVERAAAWGQPALALTDRDGLYGAVKFVRACMDTGVAPVLGVDLALGADDPGPLRRGARPRTPFRGGSLVDPRLPRVTVLARGAAAGMAPGEGWGALCRLVTATHLRGERSAPVVTPALLAEHARSARSARPGQDGAGPLVVMLGPDSDVGRAVLTKQRTQARAALERWVALLPRDCVVMEIVCHGGPEHLPGSLGQAGRMLALAREAGVRSVITAAVRHTDPQDAAVVDVLDAARRLVPLDERHLDRVTTAGHLAPTPLMHALALDVVQVSGPGLRGAGALAREQA